MARVFDNWFLSLDGEEQRAFLNRQAAESEAGREEWEAENGRPAEPQPLRPVRCLTRAEADAALAALDASFPF